MTKKIMTIMFLILVVPAFLFAGTTGKISGKITDKQTGLPLPGANVIIEGTTIGAAANINGEYFILNVPPGTYSVKASMIGYSSLIMTEVSVRIDLTTTLEFPLSSEVLDMGQSVTVVAERPLIQKDLTASRKIATADEVMAAPVENVQQAVVLTAGVSEDNFRGGRAGEATYVLDGVALKDPMTGTYESDVPLMSLEEVSVMTGGFSAEYGDIQSGLVSMVTKEGGTEYHGGIRYSTNDLGNQDLNKKFGNSYTTLKNVKDNKMFIDNFQRAQNLRNFEWSFGGPEPITHYLLDMPGKLNFFVAGEWDHNDERFPGEYDNRFSINGKVAFTPSPGYKLAFTGLRTTRKARFYDDQWKNTTYESQLDSTKEWDINNITSRASYDPADVVMHDYNGDSDFNDVLKGTDLNHNGTLNDEFFMMEAQPVYDYATDEYSLTWTHTLSPRTFYEVKLSRFETWMKYNVNERINEDVNGDGKFDPATEDLNGNGVWDWKAYGPNTDLFADENDNGYIDASENGPRNEWIQWASIPFGRYQDTQSFYMYGYGANLSYDRARWNYDRKTTYSAKVDFTSQITTRQQIKSGFSWDYRDLQDHDVDLASGGNVYGQNVRVFPNQGAFYVNDKMEYEGMILNLGMRYDYFDPNYDNYPSDTKHPVPDSLLSTGGVVLNPTSVPSKSYWSPRIGVAYPFTEKDLLHFSYGKYFQTPQLRYLFMNVNFDFSGAFPLVGNPNISPERTTAYEIGWKHQFTQDIVLNLTGYYKDITGLTDTEKIYYTFSDYYTYMINSDYANVRGFEIEMYKRRSPTGFLSGSVNYTFGVAKGKSSSYRQNYDLTWSGDIIPTTENYLDWDQRHVVKANLDLRVPSQRNLFGTSVLNDMGLNMIFKFGTGMPYSPPSRTKEPLINTERFPYTMTVDLTLDKRFKIGQDKTVGAFIWVNNLFNRKNIDALNAPFTLWDNQWYYTYTNIQKKYDDGTIDRATYMSLMDVQDPNDKDHDRIYEEADGEVDYNKAHPEGGKEIDPSIYDWGRTIRFGVKFEF